MPQQSTQNTVSQDLPKAVEDTDSSFETFAEASGMSFKSPLDSHNSKKTPVVTPKNILALQRTYGNRAVQRLLASQNKAMPKGLVQRVLPLKPLPNTNDVLTNGGKVSTPSYHMLNIAVNDLVSWTNNARTEAAKDANVKAAKKFKVTKNDIEDSVLKLWSYDNFNLGYPLATRAQNLNNNPETTLKYHLLDILWREVAKSAVRRIKRNSEATIAKLSKEMGVQASTTDIKDVAASTDGEKLKAYKQKVLQTYAKSIKKQEELASSVSFEVAYKIAQGRIGEKNGVTNDYLENPTLFGSVVDSVQSKIEKSHEALIIGSLKSLERRFNKLKTLEDEIYENSTMWDMTKNKYKATLLKKTENLRDAKYQENLFDAAKSFSTDQKTFIANQAETTVNSVKTKASEEVLALFKATSKTIGKGDNTGSRHAHKDWVEDMTKQVLSGKAATFSTVDAKGQVKTETSSEVIKKAKETAIKESVEGPIHSRFRHIGTLVEPLVPQDGDKAKLEFTLKVPVGDPTGGAYVGFRLMGQVEHEIEWAEDKTMRPGETFLRRTVDKDGKNTLKANTFKVKAELALVSGWRVPLVVDVGGEIGGYLEIETDNVKKGDTSASATGGLGRAMELLSFGYYQRAAESTVFPQRLINAIWGLGGDSASPGQSKKEAKTQEAKAWGEAFQESFSEKDFVETGGFVAGTANASITGLASFKGGLKGYRGKRYARDTMSALKEHKTKKPKYLTDRERNIGRIMNGAELSFEFNIGPFATGGKVKVSWLDNQVGSLDTDLDKEIVTLKENLLLALDPNMSDNDREQHLAKKSTAFKTDVMDKVIGDNPKKDAAKLEKLLKQRRLLKRQIYSVETEVTAASKGGNLGNPAQIVAEALKWTAEAGSKTRTAIMSAQDQYGKDNKGKNIGSSAFGSALIAIDEGVNGAKNYNPTEIAQKITDTQTKINTAMGQGVSNASTNSSELAKFAVKSVSGLKLTLKHSNKRDFKLDQSATGAKFSSKYPTKFEIIFDQVIGGSLGTQIAVVSAEKATRIFRFGIKYKDGNKSLMTM